MRNFYENIDQLNLLNKLTICVKTDTITSQTN